jgi:hypothetical protein
MVFIGQRRAGVRAGAASWLIALGIATVMAAVVLALVRTAAAGTAAGPLVLAVPVAAWGLAAGIGSAWVLPGTSIHSRPAGVMERCAWIPAIAVLAFQGGSGVLLEPGPTIALAGAVIVIVILAVGWSAWMLRIPPRLTVLTLVAVAAGPIAAVAVAFLVGRRGGAGAERAGRELCLVLPVVIAAPLAVAMLLPPVLALEVFAGAPGGTLVGFALPDAPAALVLGAVPGIEAEAAMNARAVMTAMALPLVLAGALAMVTLAHHAPTPPWSWRAAWPPRIPRWLVASAVVAGLFVAGANGMAMGIAGVHATAIGEAAVLVTFAAVGLRAPTRVVGPGSPRLALLALLGVLWLALAAAMAALARGSLAG